MVSTRRRPQRHILIASSVLLFHIAAIWVLQTGLIRQAMGAVVPVEILSEFIPPPQPEVEPPPPPPPQPRPPSKPRAQVVQRKTAPVAIPTPKPVAVADSTPTPHAPTGVIAAPVPTPSPSPPIQAPVAAATTPAPVEPKIELPSSDAEYLQNPDPIYPAQSRRMGEQGKVVVRVLIGTDGLAQKVEIRQSSGFERLDEAALKSVKNWRYVPGKRAGVVQAMWFSVPINYVLE